MLQQEALQQARQLDEAGYRAVARLNELVLKNLPVIERYDRRTLGQYDTEVVAKLRLTENQDLEQVARCGHLLVGPRLSGMRLRSFDPGSEFDTPVHKEALNRVFNCNAAFVELIPKMCQSWGGRIMLGLEPEDVDTWLSLPQMALLSFAKRAQRLVFALRIRSPAHLDALLSGSRNAVAYSFLATSNLKTWETNPYDRT